MPRWTVDAPATYDFDRVDALRVRAIGGTVAVLSTGERACLDISAVTGQPLVVSHSEGTLTVSYEDLSWDGLLGWLRPDRTAATIPSPCEGLPGPARCGHRERRCVRTPRRPR
jgi:hypothetical protein